jgi:hypothetical protein
MANYSLLKPLKTVYTVVKDDMWLMADGSWTYYGPELAGYTTNLKNVTNLAKSLNSEVKPINSLDVLAFSLEPFDDP